MEETFKVNKPSHERNAARHEEMKMVDIA